MIHDKDAFIDKWPSLMTFFFWLPVFYFLPLLLPNSCSREDGSESVLTVVNEHLRKVDHTLNVDLYNVAPPAVRCSLKGLLPYNPVKLI